MDTSRLIAVLIMPAILFLLLSYLLILQHQRRKQAGKLLLSVPRTHRFALMVIGTVMFIATTFFHPSFDRSMFVYGMIVAAIWGGLKGCSIGCLILAYSPIIEIRDEGIFREGSRFIQWSHIQSHLWGENSEGKLIINLRYQIGLKSKLKVSIDPRYQMSLEQIFQQKLGV
jgi:hypothetical protein